MSNTPRTPCHYGSTCTQNYSFFHSVLPPSQYPTPLGYPPPYPPYYPPMYNQPYYPGYLPSSSNNQPFSSSSPLTSSKTIHELKKCLVWNVNELCKYVDNTADSHTLPSPKGNKSYQVHPYSEINNIKYKLPVNLREQTTGRTKVINFWDTDIVYDLINKKDHALGYVNDLATTNLMTETAQQEVTLILPHTLISSLSPCSSPIFSITLHEAYRL